MSCKLLITLNVEIFLLMKYYREKPYLISFLLSLFVAVLVLWRENELDHVT